MKYYTIIQNAIFTLNLNAKNKNICLSDSFVFKWKKEEKNLYAAYLCVKEKKNLTNMFLETKALCNIC